MSRINNDIGEIQRVAAEAALAWVGNVLFLLGTRRRCWSGSTGGCSSSAMATLPLSLWALVHLPPRGSKRESRTLRQRSADIGSFLIETLQAHAAGRHVERAAARGRTRFRALNDAFIAR